MSNMRLLLIFVLTFTLSTQTVRLIFVACNSLLAGVPADEVSKHFVELVPMF